jgi:hypothetical protein
MEKNKTGKYFKYAIGEIILVVIGILIALSINNWNEKNNAIKKTHTYLNALNTEIESNNINIIRYIDLYHNDIKGASETLSQLHSENANYFNDSLVGNVLDTGPIYKLNIIKSTFNDLINSGILEHLNDVDLKNSILAIESNIDKFYEKYSDAKDVWDDYQLPYLMKYGNVSSNWSSISSIKIQKTPYKNKVDAFVNNKEYADILALRMRMVDNLRQWSVRLKEEFIELSNMIKVYLGKT